jgi:hypothetical protein
VYIDKLEPLHGDNTPYNDFARLRTRLLLGKHCSSRHSVRSLSSHASDAGLEHTKLSYKVEQGS